MPGDPPHAPIADVRIRTLNDFSLAVIAELRRRGARILEQCKRRRAFMVRAEAPLAALLGLPASLELIAEGEAAHSIRLVRYAPLDPQPLAA